MSRKNNDIVESVYTGYTYKVFNKCFIFLSDDIQGKGRKKQGLTQLIFKLDVIIIGFFLKSDIQCISYMENVV